MSYQEKNKEIPRPTTFSIRSKKAIALLKQRMKANVISLPEVEFLPSIAYQKNARYCSYHRRKGHMLE